MNVLLRLFIFGLGTVALAVHANAQTGQPQPPSAADPIPKQAAKPAAAKAFEFRSHRIGEVLDPSIPIWPGCRDGCEDLLRRWERGNKVLGRCEHDDDDVSIVSCHDVEATLNYAVGGVPITGLVYKFSNGKLYSLYMIFDLRQYSSIRQMLAGKYGEPTHERTSRVKNRAGGSFDNITTEWDFREGALKLDMRYVQIDTSWLTFENPMVEKQIQARRSAISRQKDKSAF